jgi:hypothetical protein
MSFIYDMIHCGELSISEMPQVASRAILKILGRWVASRYPGTKADDPAISLWLCSRLCAIACSRKPTLYISETVFFSMKRICYSATKASISRAHASDREAYQSQCNCLLTVRISSLIPVYLVLLASKSYRLYLVIAGKVFLGVTQIPRRKGRRLIIAR